MTSIHIKLVLSETLALGSIQMDIVVLRTKFRCSELIVGIFTGCVLYGENDKSYYSLTTYFPFLFVALFIMYSSNSKY